MFSFIDHVESRHGAHVHLPWEEKYVPRRSQPERLRFTLPISAWPVLRVSLPARREPKRREPERGGDAAGWLSRLFGRPVLRSAAS